MNHQYRDFQKGTTMGTETLKHITQSFVIGAFLVLMPLSSSSAEESVEEMVLNSCKSELGNYCGTVTKGRGRIAACLFAHNDKLSDQCKGAFEEGVAQLTMVLSVVNYVAEQCRYDLDTLCEGVEIGGGQIYQCLSENRAKLEKPCQTAFSEAEEDLQ